IEFVVMGNVFVPRAGLDRLVRTPPEPAPTVIRVWILRVDDDVDRRRIAQERSRNPKNKFAVLLGDLERIRYLALAPLPAFPPTDGRSNLPVPDFRHEKQIALKRQKNRRSFRVLAEGQNGRADFLARPECDKNVQGGFSRLRWAIAEEELTRRYRDRDRDIIRAGQRWCAQDASLSAERTSLNRLLRFR
ncbi:MAG: hypothetical protein QOI49_2246, partial [Verrucomicrobiota bacterium]